MNELIFFDAEESNFRFFLFEIYTLITNKKSSFTVQISSFRQFSLTIREVLFDVDVLIEFFSISRFDVMMNTTISFTRIVLLFAKINNNNKILIENVILKFFHNFFKHLESLVVDEKIQMSRRHTIDEFLNNESQTEIENEKKSSSDHDDDDFEDNDITKISECKRRRKRRRKIVNMILIM